MWGNDIALSDGITVNVDNLPGSPDQFVITGTGTINAPTVIQFDPALTPQRWDRFEFIYDGTFTLGTGTLTVMGELINTEQIQRQLNISSTFDGSVWITVITINSSSLPLGDSEVYTRAIPSTGLSESLDINKLGNYIIYTGTETLSGSVSVFFFGTFKKGQLVIIDYQAKLTQGVNTVTLQGCLLTAAQAAGGDSLIIAKYDGSAWHASLVAKSLSKDLMFEPGSAGAGSCTRNKATTGCDATGIDAFAAGNNAKATGSKSAAFNNSTSATGIDSFASGYSTTASATRSTAMGNTTIASGQGSMAVNDQTTASGLYAFSSGTLTVASGEASFTQGYKTYAKTPYSMTTGKYSTSTLIGSRVHSSGRFSIIGDCQKEEVQLRISITDATPTNLKLDDATEGILIPTDSTVSLRIRLMGVQTNATVGAIGDSFYQEIELLVKNVAGTLSVCAATATTVAGVQTVTSDVIYKNASGALAAIVAASVGVSGTKVQINVTGAVSRTIRIGADVDMFTIGYRNYIV